MSNALFDVIRGAAEGTGMVQRASDVKRLKKDYDEYNLDAQENGKEPMTIEEFAKSRKSING